jgi:hypothetical protein
MEDNELQEAHRYYASMYDAMEEALGVVLVADAPAIKMLLELGIRACGLVALVQKLRDGGPAAVIDYMKATVINFNASMDGEMSRIKDLLSERKH